MRRSKMATSSQLGPFRAEIIGEADGGLPIMGVFHPWAEEPVYTEVMNSTSPAPNSIKESLIHWLDAGDGDIIRDLLPYYDHTLVKSVKSGGHSGRVILPAKMIGMEVAIVLIDSEADDINGNVNIGGKL